MRDGQVFAEAKCLLFLLNDQDQVVKLTVSQPMQESTGGPVRVLLT